VILGPDAELQLRRALQLANGDVTTLVSTPLSVVVYLVIAALLLFPLVGKLRKGRTPTPPEPPRERVGV
jgi:putative tricarboxylic transport membrane protein